MTWLAGGYDTGGHTYESRNQLCDGVSKGRVGVHMEDWEGVLAVYQAAIGQDDGDEMDARGPQEGERSRSR